MNDFIELQRIISIVLRRWWLLVMMTAVAAFIGYTISRSQTPVYEATTTVVVGQIMKSTNLSREDVQTSATFAQTYADLAVRQPVLSGVVEVLKLNESWQDLRERVQVSTLEGTQLIEIKAQANSPEMAEKIANEVANHLILIGPAKLSDSDANFVQSFVHQQMEDTQARILNGQKRVREIEAAMEETTSATELFELQTEKSNLERLVADHVLNYVELLNLSTQDREPNSLSIIEEAHSEKDPVRPRVNLNTLLSGGLGLLLGLGFVFVLEFTNDALRTSDEITREFGLPVIGFIDNTGSPGDRKKGELVSKQPASSMAEAYRWLSANLELIDVDNPLKTIQITSCERGVGKSSISANLAIMMAQGEKKTILLDADLSKSSIHNLMGLQNRVGLSDLIRSEMDVSKALQPYDGVKVEVITGGNPPPNPAEWFRSKRMDKILANLEEIADVVIIDSPPVTVSDALLLSAKVDGVLLVIQAGYTRKKYVQKTIEQLNRAGARVIGVVFNHIPHRGRKFSIGFLRSRKSRTSFANAPLNTRS